MKRVLAAIEIAPRSSASATWSQILIWGLRKVTLIIHWYWLPANIRSCRRWWTICLNLRCRPHVWVSWPRATKIRTTIHVYLATLKLDWKRLDSLVKSRVFESLLPTNISQSRSFVEREIARITSLSSHDNPEERRLVNELESILRSMLKDIETTKDLEEKKTQIT